MAEKLGDWRWHAGQHENDDEMADCGTREDAIQFGMDDHRWGGSRRFWIVEARYSAAAERAMADGKRDTAPFADTRNGTWITVGQDGEPIEEPPHVE